MNLTPTESLILRACLTRDAQTARDCFVEWMSRWQLRSNAPWNIAAPEPELALLGRVMMHDGITDLAGGSRPTLAGIRRLNWALSARQSVLFEQHARNLAEMSPIMLLKGAALRLLGKPPAERRHSDVDLAVPPDKVHAVLALLESLNFLPSHGTDYREISHRLLQRRDGWNFEHPSGLNLDLHWRLFEHRGGPSTVDAVVWKRASCHQLPQSHAEVLVPDRSSLGVYALYHAFVRGTARDRLQHLLDLADLINSDNAQSTYEMASSLGLGNEFLDRLGLLEQLGVGVSVSTINLQTSPTEDLPSEPWLRLTPATGHRAWHLAMARSRMRPPAEALETQLLPSWIVYRVWSALGYLSCVEKLLIRRKPLVRSVDPDRLRAKDRYDLAELSDRNAILGPGWSWRGANEDFVWSDRLESRLVIPANGSKQGHVLIEFSPIALSPPRQDGRFSCSPTGEIYANAVFRASYNFTLTSQPLFIKIPYELRKKQRNIEVSFKPTALVNHRTLGPVYQSWKQSVPLKSVSLIEDSP